jgi:hypothetical protein
MSLQQHESSATVATPQCVRSSGRGKRTDDKEMQQGRGTEGRDERESGAFWVSGNNFFSFGEVQEGWREVMDRIRVDGRSCTSQSAGKDEGKDGEVKLHELTECSVVPW